MMKTKIGKMERAIFAAGCFWHPEKTFSEMEGVENTSVGYVGGKVKNPSYKQVCFGNTGHVEAVEVVFNPEKVSYTDLLNKFWEIHNPTTKNRQGWDIGSQYNSVIFYTDNKQKTQAENSKKCQQRKTRRKIVTKIKKAPKFWPAEEYHQKYIEKQSN